MEFKIVADKDSWNRFIIENEGSFLQSFEWGEFQEQFFKKIWRVEINEGGREILEAQVVKERVFFINHFYIPYGPVFNNLSSSEEKEKSFNLFLKEIEKLAKKENAIFLRIESASPLPKTENFYFRGSLKRNQPQRTLLLNLEKSEEQHLADMHIRTRYNVRLAQRKGVEIKILDDYSNIFYHLLGETKERQSFSSYSEEHYKRFFKISSKVFQTKMFLAEYQKKVIVASIIILFGNKVISLHAGSDYEYRALKGADLLHWQAALYGKKLGYKIYDFWGIDEKKYPGVTNFKRGFKGNEIEYPLGIDIIFNNIEYQIYRMLRKIKRLF